MAITATNKTSGSSSGSSVATASITPTANTLILVTVQSRRQAANPSEIPTATGNSLTYVQIDTQTSPAVPNARVTVFRAMGASPTAGAITFDFAGASQDQVNWSVAELANINTSGTNGSGAIVQSVKGRSMTNALSLTLAAFSSVNNATYGGTGWATGSSPVVTKGANFTEISQSGDATCAAESEFAATNQTTVNWTCSVADSGAGIAIEIKAAAAAAATPSRLPLLGVG